MAELSTAAIGAAMVRNGMGASSVDRLGYVEIRSVKIILASYADEGEKNVSARVCK